MSCRFKFFLKEEFTSKITEARDGARRPIPGSPSGCVSLPGHCTSWSLSLLLSKKRASPVAQQVKNPPAMQVTQEIQVRSLGGEDPLEEAWQPTSVFLPGELPWTEEPGGLQSIGSQESDMSE